MPRIFTIAFLLVIVNWGYGLPPPTVQEDSYALEKLYLHTDRGIYSEGQRIFFNAYLINAVTHVPSITSRMILVELWSPEAELVVRVKVHSKNGVSSGDINIPDNVLEGSYLLKAYTRYQLNGPEELLFRKSLKILNEKVNVSPKPAEVRQITVDVNQEKAEIPDIQFFPEGGKMIYGETATIGFKGIDPLGYGFRFSGEIWNGNEKVGEFESNDLGMGKLLLVPRSGLNYHAIVEYDGNTFRYKLPEAKEAGYLLTAKKYKNKILAQARHVGKGEKVFKLVMHSRGKILSMIPSEEGTISISSDISQFPQGIITLSLVDEEDNIVAERLLFSGSTSLDKVIIEYDSSTQKIRSKFEVGFRADLEFEEDSLFLSMSVCRPDFTSGIESDDILSYFLLSSDLKGHIENPGWYFSDENTQRDTDLDNLLLTQGWRKYNGDSNNEEMNSIVDPDLGIDVSGKLVNYFDKERAERGTIYMTFKENLLYQEKFETDEDGIFKIENLSFYDTLNLILQSKKFRKRGREVNRKDALQVIFDEPDFPTISHIDSLTLGINTSSPRDGAYQQMIERLEEINLAYFVDSTSMILEEIEVEAKVLTVDERLEEGRNIIYQNPDRRMVVDSIILGRSKRLIDLLRRVPGVRIVGSWPDEQISIRGNGTPIFTMDGVIVDWEVISSFFGEQIEFIDVLYGARSAVYGMRGGTGVVAIYTRNSMGLDNDDDWGINTHAIVGYQTPTEFYSPNYEVQREEHVIPDFRPTLYWEPNIKIRKGEMVSTTFYTSDEESDYLIVVEGISSSGNLLRVVKKLSVRR